MNNTTESKEMAIFLAELANGIHKIGARWEWIDALNFLNAAVAAPAAFSNIKLIDNEFTQWTEADKKEVIDTFILKLKFDNQVTEAEVEAVFSNAVSLAKSIQVLLEKDKVAEEVTNTNSETISE